jgi:hypothetical protein
VAGRVMAVRALTPRRYPALRLSFGRRIQVPDICITFCHVAISVHVYAYKRLHERASGLRIMRDLCPASLIVPSRDQRPRANANE